MPYSATRSLNLSTSGGSSAELLVRNAMETPHASQQAAKDPTRLDHRHRKLAENFLPLLLTGDK